MAPIHREYSRKGNLDAFRQENLPHPNLHPKLVPDRTLAMKMRSSCSASRRPMHIRGPCEKGRLAKGEAAAAGAGVGAAPSVAGQRSHRSGRNRSGSENSAPLRDVMLFTMNTTFCRPETREYHHMSAKTQSTTFCQAAMQISPYIWPKHGAYLHFPSDRCFHNLTTCRHSGYHDFSWPGAGMRSKSRNISRNRGRSDILL